MSCSKDQKTGKWIARFYYSNYQGERKQAFKRGFNTKKEAQEYEREYLRKLEYSNKMSFKSLYELYMEDMKHRLKERTMLNKGRTFKHRILPFFEKLELDMITPIVIRKWQNESLKGLAQSSVKTINAEFNAIMAYAYKFYNLKENPCKKAGTVGNLKSENNFNILTIGDFNKLLNVVDKLYYKILFKVLFFTGMRIGEVLALTLKDIDFSKNTISISKSYYDETKAVTSPKNKSSIRVIEINDTLKKDIDTFIKTLYDIKKKDRIFTITAFVVRQVLNKYIIEANVPRIRIHDFRHSHATMLIYNGINIVNISKRLGHSNVSTTLKRYTHLYEDENKNIIELLEKISE